MLSLSPLIFVLGQFTDLSIYVLNITTLFGLGLGVDYSLFMVSRFREELARGHPLEDAVATYRCYCRTRSSLLWSDGFHWSFRTHFYSYQYVALCRPGWYSRGPVSRACRYDPPTCIAGYSWVKNQRISCSSPTSQTPFVIISSICRESRAARLSETSIMVSGIDFLNLSCAIHYAYFSLFSYS